MLAVNFDDLVGVTEQAIVNLEALPVRTPPEENLMNDLKRLLEAYRKKKK